MSAAPIVLIGLERPEVDELRSRISRPLIAFEILPKIQLRGGELFVGRLGTWDWNGPVAAVVFHGIYENDLPTFAALALWGGPCLPSAHGMLDCRPRIPNLARVRRVSRFAALPRGYTDPGTTFTPDAPTVAKWGEWHCGEGKELVAATWTATEPTLFEPFLSGHAVRVTAIGDQIWQFLMGGENWKKTVHHSDTRLMPTDPVLADDVRTMQDDFDLSVCAADYIIRPDGSRHLLELNHIPDVTAFPEVWAAYLTFTTHWMEKR